MNILGYGCLTAAGAGVETLWEGLRAGRDFSEIADFGRACPWPGERRALALDRLVEALVLAWREIGATDLGRFGVILASTKGAVEDFAWNPQADPGRDVIAPVLREFLTRENLHPEMQACVSNACASGLSALWLARAWAPRLDHVLVLAVDEAGPFVRRGFHALGALTADRARPFAAERDGLQLGDGAAALLLGNGGQALARLTGIGLDAEGYAVTRPSPRGDSLARALVDLHAPDVVVAHGTSTVLNDQTEDDVLFARFGAAPWITGSKWAIGHTLGASGLIDCILAAEILRRQKIFALGNTASTAPEFRGRFVTAGLDPSLSARRALVTSLGFGGVHAAAQLESA